MPNRRTWRGKSSTRRRQSSSKSESESGGDSRDDRQSRPIERDAHASSSDEAINEADQLADRIALNNDIMRQCRETFETLHARNAKLLVKYESMKARLSIPECLRVRRPQQCRQSCPRTGSWEDIRGCCQSAPCGGVRSQSSHCRQSGGVGTRCA